MKKRTKFSIIFISILFALIFIAFIFAGKWTREFRLSLEKNGSIDYAKVHDVVITETKDGIKDWEVYAAVADYDNKHVQATMTDIVGNYYQNGEVIMSFTAPKGTYNSENKKIILDYTLVVGKEDAKLTADHISWVTTEDKIVAEGNVVFNKADEMIAIADKGTISKDMKNMELIDNAEVRVYSKQEK